MQTGLFINGVWSDREVRFKVFDPSTSEYITSVADGFPEDVSSACDAASNAQEAWSAEPPRKRAEILRRCWSNLLQSSDDLARLITREQGKPLLDAKDEVAYAAEFFRWNSEEVVRSRGSVGVSPDGKNRIVVQHPPVGVVVVVTPWNFPAAMIARKLAPALAAGNAVVVKPAAETPLTALLIGQLLSEAGVPDGVVNIVPTSAPGPWFEAAAAHQATRMVSFTGSTDVGRRVLHVSANRVLKTAMELGGNAPFIVFDDADVEAAVAGAMIAKMRHSGQTCTAANRFLIHADVAEEFTARFVAAMDGVIVGEGSAAGVACGPLINDRAVDRVAQLVASAVSDGARCLLGGEPLSRVGSFYPPTLLSEVSPDSEINHQEIFGPVAPIVTFDDSDKVVTMANETEMGLAAYVYTGDLARGLDVSERLEVGMVGLNRGSVSDPAAPFGGMKQSGLGREGGSNAMLEFCETQYVSVEW